jgi:hypothetical protein
MVILENKAVTMSDQVIHIVVWSLCVEQALFVHKLMDGSAVIKDNHIGGSKFKRIDTAEFLSPFLEPVSQSGACSVCDFQVSLMTYFLYIPVMGI